MWEWLWNLEKRFKGASWEFLDYLKSRVEIIRVLPLQSKKLPWDYVEHYDSYPKRAARIAVKIDGQIMVGYVHAISEEGHENIFDDRNYYQDIPEKLRPFYESRELDNGRGWFYDIDEEKYWPGNHHVHLFKGETCTCCLCNPEEDN
jgi:hypothetical protein